MKINGQAAHQKPSGGEERRPPGDPCPKYNSQGGCTKKQSQCPLHKKHIRNFKDPEMLSVAIGSTHATSAGITPTANRGVNPVLMDIATGGHKPPPACSERQLCKGPNTQIPNTKYPNTQIWFLGIWGIWYFGKINEESMKNR